MKIVTANRVTDGRVLYWTRGGDWSSNIDDAARVEGEDADAALAEALKDEARVAGPYLIEFADGRPAGRERLKETIRLDGPTVGPSKGHGASAG